MEIDEKLLDEKLAALEQAREWSPRVIAKLEALVHAPDDFTLVRVNPIAFAAERGVAQAEALELFLHAAHLGLFTMDWHLLCPACGAAVESFASLRELRHSFFCALCHQRATANLDDFIQVSFTVARAIRRLTYHDPESLSAGDFLFKLRFTREMRIGGPDGPILAEELRDTLPVLEWLAPRSESVFRLSLTGGIFNAAEFQAHTGLVATVVAGGPPGPLTIDIGERAMSASAETLGPGPLELRVRNHRDGRVVFAAGGISDAELAAGKPPSYLAPILTGAMLLTNQTFRRLFRRETVGSAEGIGVRDVTVLFTDVKGSTALYERIGDLRAFSLVQAHFQRLATAVAAHSGAMIKTIGDAVMAAFLSPADAVRAALDMRAQIARFNREQAEDAIVLKIGIHRGPSIAVTLNESLDYFGQTVNVAARVQGLADADEICVTDDVYQAEGVAALLGPAVSHEAQLRGISREVRVHRAGAAAASGAPPA